MTQKEFNNQLLLARTDATQTNIALDILENPALHDLLIEALYEKDVHVAQRASAVGVILLEKLPKYFMDYENQFIATLDTTDNSALKRVLFRLLEQAEISEDNEGLVYDLSLRHALSPTEPIAVRAYSLGILGKFIQKYPELKEEVFQTLKLVQEEPNLSAGMKSRIRKVLKLG